MYFFVAFAIIAIFTFKIPPKFGLFQILISISNVIFVMGFGFFFNQLQWSSSQSATHLSLLKISIVDSYINFQSCAPFTFIYHDTFCRKVVNEVCSFVGIKCCSRSYAFYLQYAMLPYCHIFQNSSY